MPKHLAVCNNKYNQYNNMHPIFDKLKNDSQRIKKVKNLKC